MPDGYDTAVGERGLKLSGGEKQRVAIARAFLRNPRLLVADEATSALDSATEASIMASLAELARGRTSIFVAHRLSTIKGCDHIVVLRDGAVAEEGTHAELMAAEGGVYARMWRMQAAEAAMGPKGGGGGGGGGASGSDGGGGLSVVSSSDGSGQDDEEDNDEDEGEDGGKGRRGIVEPLPAPTGGMMRGTMAAA